VIGRKGARDRDEGRGSVEVTFVRGLYLGVIAAAVLALVVLGCDISPRTGLARGRDVFQTCVPCHGASGLGSVELRAPAIAGLPEWYITRELENFRANVRGAHPDDMEGHRMRPMARTLYHPGDLADVAQYVSRMPSVWMHPMLAAGDTAAGSASFSGICATCHGADAKGNPAMGAPPLVNQADWYLVAQLKKFQSGMRGASPADSLGQGMRAMSMTLADSTSMHNVVAYIKSLPH
jgi:cytochrome c553